MKKCPNCGFENEAKSKFCIKCGSPLEKNTITTTVKNNRPKVDYSHAFNRFCEYFVESIKHPLGYKLNDGKFEGFASLGLYIIFTFVSMLLVIKSHILLSSSERSVIGYEGKDFFTNLNLSGIIDGKLAPMTGFFFVLVVLILWIVSFLSVKFLMKNVIKLSTFTDDFAKYLNLGSILLFLGTILLLFQPSQFIGFILTGFGLSISFLAFIVNILFSNNYGKLDKFYVFLISLILVLIIALILQKLLLDPINNDINNEMQKFQVDLKEKIASENKANSDSALDGFLGNLVGGIGFGIGASLFF